MADTQRDAVAQSLKQNFLFSGLSDVQVTALAAEVWIEEIPQGSVIVREGDLADSLYVVLAGGVNVTKHNGQFLAFLGRGGFFGEMALFTDQSQRSATCQATADTTCVVVRKDVLDRYCSANPEAGVTILRAIVRTLAERLQATSADLAFLMDAQVKRQVEVSDAVERAKQKRNKSR